MGSGIKVVGDAPAVDERTAGRWARRKARGTAGAVVADADSATGDAATGDAATAGTVPADAAVLANDTDEAGNDTDEAGHDDRPRRLRRRGSRSRVAAEGHPGPGRSRLFVAVCVVAVLGVVGTIVFGVLWSGLHGQQAGEAQASARAKSFLVDLTNFDSKTVDADFSAVTAMATGDFAGQADKFFDSSIRQELQRALASSRGQVRDLYVQSYGGGQATVYAVVTQLYTNDKMTSPQSDVLRIVVDMRQMGGTWKVADVTVLEGPSLGTGTTSTSAGRTG